MMAHPWDWEQEQLKIWRELSGLPQDYDLAEALLQGSFCCTREDYERSWAGTEEELPELRDLQDYPGQNFDPGFSIWTKDGYVFMLCK